MRQAHEGKGDGVKNLWSLDDRIAKAKVKPKASWEGYRKSRQIESIEET